METSITIILLYWFFCAMFAIGIDIETRTVCIWTFVSAILIGWCMLPMALGANFKSKVDE